VAPGSLQVPNLTDSLYDAMWRRIVNLEFSPGTRLSDDTLARQFGVSRTPVREALYRLSQVGLVEVNARRGFFVTQLDRQSIVELFDLRTALETFNARLAAPHIRPEELGPHLAELDEEQSRVTESTPEDAERFVKSDLRLHLLMLERAGNSRLQRALRDVNGQLSIAVLRLALDTEARLRAIEEHAVILDALGKGDADAVASAMQTHIQNVKERSLIELRL
jgi:DNA-binding GntR family transcriptional regulator